MYDDLTRLPARKAFFDRLDELTSSCKENNSIISLLVIDLVQLNNINIALGYNAGDTLLKLFAERIMGIQRDTDMTARIGDNKFALIIGSTINVGHATLAANKIISLLEQPFNIEGQEIHTSGAIGIAFCPEHAGDSEKLLLCAEHALKQAKSSCSKYKFFSGEINELAIEKTILAKELKIAIEDSQLTMHYQPKIDLHSRMVCSAEALVRWEHPTHGLVFPDNFIPMAEESGLIVPLTLWTLNTTLRQHSQSSLCDNQSVAINLSASLLHEPDLAAMITSSIEIWGARPENLILEVTESAIMIDPQKSMDTLNKLHEAGIRISIDDFGTGYSSLSYLKNLPVSELKIDKSFVMNMIEDENDKKIVRSIIDLSRNFSLNVVAEGIENEQSLSVLDGMGCNVGQGYFISRPMPMDKFRDWITSSE